MKKLNKVLILVTSSWILVAVRINSYLFIKIQVPLYPDTMPDCDLFILYSYTFIQLLIYLLQNQQRKLTNIYSLLISLKMFSITKHFLEPKHWLHVLMYRKNVDTVDLSSVYCQRALINTEFVALTSTDKLICW